MKKIFIAILSVVFALFVFSACSDGVVKETTEDPIEYGEGIVPVDNYEDISYDIADGFFTMLAEYTTDTASAHSTN